MAKLRRGKIDLRFACAAAGIIGVAALTGCGGSGSSNNFHSTAFYVTNAFSYTISQFRIQPDGSLTTLAPDVPYTTNPFGIPGSESLVFDPSRKHAYLANLGASTIDEFNVNPDGTLTQFNTFVMDQGLNSSEPSIVVFAPSGKFAYATSESSTNHKLTDVTGGA